MRTPREITERAMRGVYGVYVMRQLTRPSVRLAALLLLALSLREMVWVTRIFENISHKTDIFGFFEYSVSAFMTTELAVQLVLTFGVAIVAYSAKDLFGLKRPQFA